MCVALCASPYVRRPMCVASYRRPHIWRATYNMWRPICGAQVKFWQWAVVQSGEGGGRQLRLAHARSLAMADEVRGG
jgi:hypothetical protein